MVALAATLLPVLWAPFALNLIALTAAAGCCALFSLPAYRHLVRSDSLRVGRDVYKRQQDAILPHSRLYESPWLRM